MKVVNTRFNPTVNGPLHLGHAYMMLVNEFEAHSRGGKFLVRWDDNQDAWRDAFTDEAIVELEGRMIEDINWLGINVDSYSSQVRQEEYTYKMIEKFNKGRLDVPLIYYSMINPEVLNSDVPHFPYVPHFTAEKVILDQRDHITDLIRGEDLLGEFSLYCYFCELWRLPMPHHIYMPRLRQEKGELSPVYFSKTAGGYSIRDYREQGASVDYILARLREACLVNPNGDWSYQNVKREPVWRE